MLPPDSTQRRVTSRPVSCSPLAAPSHRLGRALRTPGSPLAGGTRTLFTRSSATPIAPLAVHRPFSSSQESTLSQSSNDESWWVVCVGDDRGVYHEDMVQSETERAAYSLFVQLYMSRRIQDF